jgi:cation transport regulator ChaC
MAVYFAYGSNMSSARFAARVSDAEALGRAQVIDWRLAFNKPGRDGTGKANLVPTAGARTWGVAWTLPEDAWRVLDGFEPDYERAVLPLRRADGRELHAHVYLYACPADTPSIPPSRDYVDHLVSGATEHGLPEEYIAKIRAFGDVS